MYYMYGSRLLAEDGRPIIEVTHSKLRGEILEIAGTAVVYEGNVVLSLERNDGAVEVSSVQASAGGPSRGHWSAAIPITAEIAAITIGQEEMGEGNLEGEAGTVRVSVDELV